VVLALISPSAQLGCGSEEPPPKPIRPVRSLVVADLEGMEGRRFAGQARAIQEANLAFEVPGRLIEFPVLVGDVVEPGQVLARLDPRDFMAELKSAEAEFKRDQTNLDRGREMLAEDVISKVNYDRMEARRDISQAKVELAAKALEDSVLRAPFSGTVAATYAENYENVRKKQQVLRVLDTSRIEMVIQIPESLISSVPFVTEIGVRFDSFPDVLIPATVTEIGNEASTTTRTYPITLVMDPPEGVAILPGMAGEATGHASLSRESGEPSIEVPVAAVFTDDASQSEQSYVWVVDERALTVARRPVESVGISARGVLIKGLVPGQRIVTAGANTLREGQPVRLQD
jgi:RND family efflux transporter MFP subunit